MRTLAAEARLLKPWSSRRASSDNFAGHRGYGRKLVVANRGIVGMEVSLVRAKICWMHVVENDQNPGSC